MPKNKFIAGIIALSILLAAPAQADLLGTLKDATNIIKSTGVLDKVSPPTSEPQQNGTTLKSAKNTVMPFGLTVYPGAEPKDRFDNPFDQVDMPISLPTVSRMGKASVVTVPTEGKVTLLSFVHQENDSPLLIKQHYESWLASNGFERMLVCQSPCKALVTSRPAWTNIIDPLAKINSNNFPNNATVIVAYKNDAMAFVMIGKYLFAYSSVVKVVEGRVIDNTNWKKLMTPAAQLTPVEPSKPAAAKQVDTVASSVYAQQISPYDLLQNVENSKGPVLVHLSSLDKNCSYCAKSNPNFDNLAGRYRGQPIKFWQSGAQPWPDSLKIEFAKKYASQGVPMTFLFKDGKLVEKVQGLTDIDELERKLIVVTNALGKTAEPAGSAATQINNVNISTVQAVSANDALQRITTSKGVVFIQVSSYDKACNNCASANINYDGLSARHAGKGEFWQVTAQPWGDALKSDLVRVYGIEAVPATLVFKDGKIAKPAVYGSATTDELDKKLVQ